MEALETRLRFDGRAGTTAYRAQRETGIVCGTAEEPSCRDQPDSMGHDVSPATGFVRIWFTTWLIWSIVPPSRVGQALHWTG